MKKLYSFLSITLFLSFCSVLLAQPPVNSTKWSKYLSVRYKAVNHGGQGSIVDFQNVLTVVRDAGSVSKLYFKADSPSYSGYDWVFFKNGDKIILDSSQNARILFSGFITFLASNPEFLNVP